MLSSDIKGGCVLGTRVRNANGKFEYSFINEDCNTKAQLACVASAKNFGIKNIDPVRKIKH
jgi:hypothetical protein